MLTVFLRIKQNKKSSPALSNLCVHACVLCLRLCIFKEETHKKIGCMQDASIYYCKKKINKCLHMHCFVLHTRRLLTLPSTREAFYQKMCFWEISASPENMVIACSVILYSLFITKLTGILLSLD